MTTFRIILVCIATLNAFVSGDDYPLCSDPYEGPSLDGQGDPSSRWGWENGKSCRIIETASDPDPQPPSQVQPTDQAESAPVSTPADTTDPRHGLDVNPIGAPSQNTTKPSFNLGPGLAGMFYTTWHGHIPWKDVWGTPLGGPYLSTDEKRMELHAQWLECAGIDFILVDWSNNNDYLYPNDGDHRNIEESTVKLFEVFNRIGSPIKIAIMIGNGPVDVMQRKVDSIKELFLSTEENQDRYFNYKGKPLVVKFQSVTNTVNNPENMDFDSSITIRSMGAFLTQLSRVNSDKVGYSPHWSWEDRYTDDINYVISVDPKQLDVSDYSNDVPPSDAFEATVITPACRGEPLQCPNFVPDHPWDCSALRQGRQNGRFLEERMDNAIKAKVPMVLVGTWNEFKTANEQKSPEFSKDFEPTEELKFEPLELLRKKLGEFKAVHGQEMPQCSFQDP